MPHPRFRQLFGTVGCVMPISAFLHQNCNAGRRPSGPAIGPRALPDLPAHRGFVTCDDGSFKLHAAATREDLRYFTGALGLVTTGSPAVLVARLQSADSGTLPAAAFVQGVRVGFDVCVGE